MILGRFKWRDMELQADRAVGQLSGDTVWLNRIDDGTGIATYRNGRLILTAHAPDDDTATVELRAAFDRFRASLPRSVP